MPARLRFALLSVSFLLGPGVAQADTDAPEPAPDSAVPAAVTTAGILDPDRLDARPDDATQLVGDDAHRMVPEREGAESQWTFGAGVLTAPLAFQSVVTPETYTDFRLHLEFNVNDKPGASTGTNGNSGIYIQKRYEIQILNSFGIPEDQYKNIYCASIYTFKKPDHIVCRPAGQWQSFDIVFRAARFDGDEKTENARITVYHNGTLIHDDVDLPDKTGRGEPEGPEPGPIKLQGKNNPVQFRNVWVQVLDLGE